MIDGLKLGYNIKENLNSAVYNKEIFTIFVARRARLNFRTIEFNAQRSSLGDFSRQILKNVE